MRKFCLLLSVLMLISCAFAGCKEPEVKTGNEAFFELRETPTDIASEKSDGELISRLFETYKTSIAASKDYGELIPFVGKYLTYTPTDPLVAATVTIPVYGFCKTDGTIVCDAVFTYVRKCDIGDGTFVYEIGTGTDGSVAGKRAVMKSDGSWILDIKEGGFMLSSMGGGMFAVRRPIRLYRNGVLTPFFYYDFHNANGKRLFTFNKELTVAPNTDITFGNFSDGLIPVTVKVKDPAQDTETVENYYINKKGEIQFTPFLYAGEFNEGLAIVSAEEGLYGVIKTDGTYLLTPKYTEIKYYSSKGYYLCEEEACWTVFDKTGKMVTRVMCQNSDVTIIDSKSIIYRKISRDTNRAEFLFSETNKPLVCASTGKFPDVLSGQNGLFYSTYSNVTDFFNEDGKTIISFTEFGALVKATELYAVVSNKSENAILVFNRTTGEKTDWMKYEYNNTFLNGKYIIFKGTFESTKGYSLYDPEKKQFMFKNSAYMEVFGNYLTVYDDEFITVYNDKLQKVLKYARGWAE